MIASESFSGKTVALFGLGGSGLATAHSLLAGGAQVAAWDDTPTSREKAAAAGVPLVDLAQSDWGAYSAFVLSPGVPLTHPKPHWTVERARMAGVEIIGDIELFCRQRALLAPKAPFIAITGTNGKSTTTALIAHLLRAGGKDVQLGGNIGVPALSLDPFNAESEASRVYVLELSSFQIDLAPSVAPDVGVLLNLTPDHLDRHGAMDHYAAIKQAMIDRSDRAVIAIDDAYTRAIGAARLNTQKETLFVSAVQDNLPIGLVADGAHILLCLEDQRYLLADLSNIASLRGRHNAQNAVAAIGALMQLAAQCYESDLVDPVMLQKALRDFPGLPHRMEQVGQRGRFLFINDSKATNADAAEKALSAFDAIYWIAGGLAKEGGIESLRPLFPHIKKAYLIGAAAEAFALTLGDAVPHVVSGDMETALKQAACDAEQENAAEACMDKNSASDIAILLSPACASYDQFANFEQRGNLFRDSVGRLLVELSAGDRP